jgi:polyhydroxyalkanoate synthesis regulator phasin
MASVDDCIKSGEASLSALYTLQTDAMKAGNIAAQKALKDDIDDLTYKLTLLRRQEIDDDNAQINALNAQLGQVTATAQTALKSLDHLSDVLADVVGATSTLDGILGAVAAA